LKNEEETISEQFKAEQEPHDKHYRWAGNMALLREIICTGKIFYFSMLQRFPWSSLENL